MKNDGNLNFIFGYDIEIDASLSYDESSLRLNSKNQEKKLSFNWSCPPDFKSLCSTTNNTLLIKASDYQSIFKNPAEIQINEFNLTLLKDRRSTSKKFSIILRLPKPEDINNEPVIKEIDLTDLILINPLTMGGSLEVILGVAFLDKNLNIFDYTYFWSVKLFKKNTQYLNGRKEVNLKILIDDLLTGLNDISLEVTDLKSKKTFYKNFSYEKARAPYSGNCVVSPSTGISMITNFKFSIDGWISKSELLVYKIKYLNSDKVLIDISHGGFVGKTWFSSMIPFEKDFIVEVTDSSGLFNSAPCSIKVKPNTNLEPLSIYLDEEFDPYNRMLLVEIYKSNKNDKANNSELNDNALNMLGDFINISGSEINQDIENIIAKILQISDQDFDCTKLEIVNNSIQAILDNIEPLLNNIEKMQNVYRIIDNIFKKASSNDKYKKDKSLLEKIQSFLNILNSKLFNNMINGQGVIVENENYLSQMNKVSSLNIPDLSVNYNSEEKKIRKKTKIRRLQQSILGCDEFSAICLPKDNITSIMSQSNSKGIGFQGQLNHKSNIPIEYPQYSNSLDFGISTDDGSGKLRRLNTEDFRIKFEIRLKMPVIEDNSTIHTATCLQYIEGKADTSCESWYDLNTNEVICYCSKQGLTVNILDKALSNLSKLKQFPNITSDICKLFF